MKKRTILLLLTLLIRRNELAAQIQPMDSIRIAFWNLENFFDPFVDTTLTYNEFTEQGSQHWTVSRFYRKRNNLYKAILAFSEGQPLGILGLCEVENDYVLNALFAQTPLNRFHYSWIHYDGPDRRGIDPAIVYSKDVFQLLHSEVIPYRNPQDVSSVSRDILYAKFIDWQHDTIHCFVNHWPSKYRGELETVEARNCAARILRHKVDSLVANAATNDLPKIIIMGDFNDTPDAPCIREVLNARHLSESLEEATLVNLFACSNELGFKGTLKYQDAWSIFDQIIVSKSLITSKSLHCNSSDARIVHESFLLTDDPIYHGLKLNRTFVGPKYFGGFSDHLPVVLLLRY